MKVSKLQAWIMAARPRTLPAAVSPVLVGSALAFYEGVFRPGPALAALLGSLLIQIGANFANDFMDFLKGSDTHERLGPTRVTAAGLLSLREVQVGTVLVFALAVLCGLYLTYAAGWPVVVIGVLAILSALAYTGGPYPLGYNGLGEIFVFLFFGLAAVGGTYYVLARSYSLAAFAASIPVGCLVVAILVVNNLRDIATDRTAGKRTQAVRHGEQWTRREYALLLVLAFFSPVLMALSGLLPGWVLLAWLALPMGFRLIRAIGTDSGRALNRSLGGTGSLELVFALLFALDLLAGKFFSSSTPSSALIPGETSTAAVPASSAPTLTLAPAPSPTSNLPIRPFVWKGQTRPLLLAHYMPWYQTPAVSGAGGYHWTMNHFNPTQKADGSWQDLASHNIPLTGPYDSNDPAVLEYQMMLMKLSGIDGVIVDWYGIEDFWDYGTINTSTQALFAAVKKAGLMFAVCYEDQTILHMLENNHLQKDEAIPHAQKVMAFLQSTWFNDPAYLKVSGRPLLFNFGPQYFKQDADWKAIFANTSPQPLLITLDNTIGPTSAAAFPWPPMSLSQAGVLSIASLQSYLEGFYLKAQAWPVHIGGAFPGFHDIYKEAGVGEGYGFLDALDGRTFRLTLQAALDHPIEGQPEMIQLITWNDYGEGTVIEPTVEFGYRYLEILQELNGVLTGGKFAFTHQDLRLPFKLYQLRLKAATDQTALRRIDQAVQALFSGDLAAARSLSGGNP